MNSTNLFGASPLCNIYAMCRGYQEIEHDPNLKAFKQIRKTRVDSTLNKRQLIEVTRMYEMNC